MPATEDYAIVVGIDDYRPPPFSPLQGACNDAKDFIDWLKASTGGDLPNQNVDPFVELSTPNDGRPSWTHVHELLNRMLERVSPSAETSRIGRRLYIFLAGHGITMRDLDEGYLVTVEAKNRLVPTLPGRLTANLFAMGAHFEEIILFMDCCRLPNTLLKPSSPPFSIFEDAEVAGRAARFYVFATAYGQIARETSDNGTIRGIFSRTLLKGLRGGAVDGYGRITTASLREYLLSTLSSPEIKQPPKFASTDDIIFVQGLPPRREMVTLRFLSEIVDLTVLDGSTFQIVVPIEDLTLLDGARQITLPAGRTYLFEATEASGASRKRPWVANGKEPNACF